MSSDLSQDALRVGTEPVIYILSGGVGASAEQLVYTVLAQYPANNVRVVTVGNIRQGDQISRALQQAREANALVVFTMVDFSLRDRLMAEVQALGLPAIDLMTPLIEWISAALDNHRCSSRGGIASYTGNILSGLRRLSLP
jgi:regulator of PEP synthase PpsR (kinase-PPPase family)